MGINAGLYSSDSPEWETPQDLFDRLNRVWRFTLDVAATAENAKCERYYDRAMNGLAQGWAGERCWLNPPYGREIGEWVAKAHQESQWPGTVVVCLLPARTDTRWWQTYVAQAALIRFLPGRLHFGGSKNSAPFPSAVVIFGGIA